MRRLSSAAGALGAAALIIVGGGAYALASSSGGSITVCVKHGNGTLYKAGKCARHDKKLTWNKVGPPGPQGPKGDAGQQGPKGDTGAQGPGGTILTYDAKASSTPTFTILPTVLGDTWSAECSIPAAGQAELIVDLKTADGSFTADIGLDSNNNGTSATDPHRDTIPAGTLSTPQTVISAQANAGGSASDVHYDFVQTGPALGHMLLNGNATTTTTPASQTCHMSVESFPETVISSGSTSAIRVRARLARGL